MAGMSPMSLLRARVEDSPGTGTSTNDLKKGYRPQLSAFPLQNEPCVFTFDRQGRIAARLAGSFGVNAFTRALDAAQR